MRLFHLPSPAICDILKFYTNVIFKIHAKVRYVNLFSNELTVPETVLSDLNQAYG